LYPEEVYQFPSNVLIILSRNWETYSLEEKNLLAKILSSVKLDIASVHIITEEVLSLPKLLSYKPLKVLIFGSHSEGIRPYEAVQAQGLSIIKADDLSELDDAKKKSLWLGLKSMFSI
jgi:hypothetical protein